MFQCLNVSGVVLTVNLSIMETARTHCEGVYDPLGLVNLSNACLQMIAEPLELLVYKHLAEHVCFFHFSLYTVYVC